jgi:hypothetical protein
MDKTIDVSKKRRLSVKQFTKIMFDVANEVENDENYQDTYIWDENAPDGSQASAIYRIALRQWGDNNYSEIRKALPLHYHYIYSALGNRYGIIWANVSLNLKGKERWYIANEIRRIATSIETTEASKLYARGR